jgi:hypothetical protein
VIRRPGRMKKNEMRRPRRTEAEEEDGDGRMRGYTQDTKKTTGDRRQEVLVLVLLVTSTSMYRLLVTSTVQPFGLRVRPAYTVGRRT